MGSYGMTEEHRLKTAANLSACWDGEAIKRLRAGDGPTNIVGHRLSMHLMLQPEASQLLLGSGVLRDQGLLSRLLVSAVPSLAGTRFHREVDSLDEVTIEKFAEKTFKLLDLEPPLIEGSRNELEPRSLPLSKEAKALFYQYSDSLEAEMGKSGELANLKDIASKAPENALRISAVIALFENIAITEISHEMMKRGIKLMDWYLSEISRLYEIGRVDPQLISAQMLLSWIQAWAQKKDTNIVTERDIARNGPKSLRNAKSLKPIVKVLCDHNWLIALGAKGYKLYKKED
jgi:hypothetical protein